MGLARAAADALGGAYFALDPERDAARAVLVRENDERVELDFSGLRRSGIEADLRARDFTVNAMAAEPDGRLIDPTGGLADLQGRLVRSTGEAALDDDPLRMLRAVRLMAELELRLEAKTATWIIQRAPALARVSAERVRDELVRVLAAPGIADHVHMLDELHLLARIVPEVESLREQAQSPPHRFDVWWHTLLVVEGVEGVVAAMAGVSPRTVYIDAPRRVWDDLRAELHRFAAPLADHFRRGHSRMALLRMAALCHDLGKPLTCSEDEEGRLHFCGHEQAGAEIAGRRMGQLRFSRAEVQRVQSMVRAHLRPAHLARGPLPLTRRAVYRFFRDLEDAGVEVVLLSVADHIATWGPNLQPERWERRLEAARTLLGSYFERPEEALFPAALVTGRDLIDELGLEPGPELGRLLEALREAQAAGEVCTREEALALARSRVDRDAAG